MNRDTVADVREIGKLSSEIASTLRRIDEKKLNRILDVIPSDKLRKIVRKPLPKPTPLRRQVTLRTPPRVRALIQDAALLDEPDPNRRMQLFIGFCRFRRYSYNTTATYINLLKSRGVFGDDPQAITVKPSKLAFADSGKSHERMITMDSFVKMFKYLRENFTKYYAPLLVAMYTGLRTFEILQWSVQTLYQLRSRHEYVSVQRKQTVITMDSESTYWRPVYTTRFLHFIDQLVDLYHEEYQVYEKDGIDDQLFPVTPKTLSNRIRILYFEITGHHPPFGFGIHSCRNMIATLMANETENITAIQTFLQHRSVVTTQKYINVDLRFVRKEFDRLTRKELSSINEDLAIPSNDDDDDDDGEENGDESAER